MIDFDNNFEPGSRTSLAVILPLPQQLDAVDIIVRTATSAALVCVARTAARVYQGKIKELVSRIPSDPVGS